MSGVERGGALPGEPADRAPWPALGGGGRLCAIQDVETVSLALLGDGAAHLAPGLGPFDTRGRFGRDPPTQALRLAALSRLGAGVRALGQDALASALALPFVRSRLPARRVGLEPGRPALRPGAAAALDLALAPPREAAGAAFGGWEPPWRPGR